MERALLLDTDRVRFDDEVDYALCPGKSTAEAVRHGIALAQTGAVTLLMARLNLAESQFVFCGGGSGFWLSQDIIGGAGGGLTGGAGFRDDNTLSPGGGGGTQSSSANGMCSSTNNPAVAGGFGFGGSTDYAICGGCEGEGGGGSGSGNCRGGGGSSYIAGAGLMSSSTSSGVRSGNGGYLLGIVGWTNFVYLPTGDIGSFLEGAFAPLAFLWLVIGHFMQQKEITANTKAISLQEKSVRRLELHSRRDSYFKLLTLVQDQLGSISAFHYISVFGDTGSGKMTFEEFSESRAHVGNGDHSYFIRLMTIESFNLRKDPATV